MGSARASVAAITTAAGTRPRRSPTPQLRDAGNNERILKVRRTAKYSVKRNSRPGSSTSWPRSLQRRACAHTSHATTTHARPTSLTTFWSAGPTSFASCLASQCCSPSTRPLPPFAHAPRSAHLPSCCFRFRATNAESSPTPFTATGSPRIDRHGPTSFVRTPARPWPGSKFPLFADPQFASPPQSHRRTRSHFSHGTRNSTHQLVVRQCRLPPQRPQPGARLGPRMGVVPRHN
jgi:hypothetical protein